MVCFKVANINLSINTGMNIKLNLPHQMKIVRIHSLIYRTDTEEDYDQELPLRW